jgi:hypothetical protein
MASKANREKALIFIFTSIPSAAGNNDLHIYLDNNVVCGRLMKPKRIGG